MPSCCWKEQGGRMLTEIAMDVRMAISGASDHYPKLKEDIELLQKAIKFWEPSTTHWTRRVDDSIKHLIENVLLEIHRNDGLWLKNLFP